MKIKSVQYEACFNLGDYENEKLRLVAVLDEDEKPEEVVKALRDRTLEMANPNAEKVGYRIYELKNQLRDLERKMEQKTEQWNKMAEFLRTQGVNAEAQDMPIFTNLLEPGEEVIEEAEVVPEYDEIPL